MRASAILTALLVVAGESWFQLDAAKSDDLNDDYAIYSEVLRTNYISDKIKHLVIGDHTMMNFPPVMMAYTEFGGSHEMKKIRAATSKETFTDYDEKNKSSIALQNRFSVPVGIILLSASERDKLFAVTAEAAKGGHGAQRFEELNRLYPNSQGFMSVSRIGFNRTKTQALLYLGNVCGGLCGTGQWFLLVRQGDAWKIRYAATSWVS